MFEDYFQNARRVVTTQKDPSITVARLGDSISVSDMHNNISPHIVSIRSLEIVTITTYPPVLTRYVPVHRKVSYDIYSYHY